MSDRVTELEAKVSSLTELVTRLVDRVSALEAARPAARAPAAAAAAAEAAPAAPGPSVASAVLPLGGRTLLALAGGFVLRALTDSGVTPGWAGVALGLSYALGLALLAAFAARGNPASATAHGLAAALVAFPLLYEAVTRFQLLGAAAATALLGLAAAVLLGVAGWRRLVVLAWLAAGGATVTALVLGAQTDRDVPAALLLVLLGVACTWLCYGLGWRGLQWVSAAMADLLALGVALRSMSPSVEESPRAAMLVLVLLLALYLGSFAARTVLLRRGAGPFEVVQTAGAIGAGLGGAAIIAAHTATSAAGLGAVAAACGAAAYGAALAAGRADPRRAGFAYHGAVAALLVLSGTALALGRAPLALLWSSLAVAAAALARRLGRPSLAAHAAIYAWGSAIAGGLATPAVDALVAPTAVGWEPPRAPALAALAAAAACAWLTADPGESRGRWTSRLPWAALVLLLAACVAGLAVAALAPAVAGAAGAEASRGAVAVVRTAVLVTAAALLAWAGRRDAWREAAWIGYAVLGLTGVKILAEDLPAGRPATLIVTFGLYGAALLLVPRLRRRAPTAKPGGGEPPRKPAG